MNDEKIIKVNSDIAAGELRCPNCGSAQIEPNPKTGKLKCNYCQIEFDGKEVKNTEKNLSKLKGKVRGRGTSNIKTDAKDVITLKCGGCGAEVVIDTKEAPHARCHWCRSILSINNQIDNGAIPDVILPFQTKKEEAEEKIKDFVHKRSFFANPNFKKEFTTENIMGVYFPYLLVDGNCHAKFLGEGEHLVREYTVSRGNNRRETRYDADLYKVGREFDITIDDLSIESNSIRIDKTRSSETNNIINSIMPFDTENCIQYQSNYLIGYTSERRDINVDDIEGKVEAQFRDIARFSAKEDAKFYDRGIRWDNEELKTLGSQWLAAYLPVWLYSYQEVKGKKKTLHYVAVNGRTGETMGSIPVNKPLLFIVSAIIEVLSFIIAMFLFISASRGDDDNAFFFFFILVAGFVYYGAMYARYRNQEARHTYEKETKKEVTNIERIDEFIKHEKGLSNSMMRGRNDHKLEGENLKVVVAIKEVVDIVNKDIE